MLWFHKAAYDFKNKDEITVKNSCHVTAIGCEIRSGGEGGGSVGDGIGASLRR